MSNSIQLMITIGCHSLADLATSVKDLVAPLLSYEQKAFCQRDGRVNVHTEYKQLFLDNDNGKLIFPVGCVPRVATALLRAGHDVRVKDHRGLDEGRLRLELFNAKDAEAACRGILECMLRYREGVLAVPRGRSRGRAVGAMCRLFPNAKFFVVSATRRRNEEMAAELGHFVGGEVQAVHGGDWASSCRVVCGTFTSFDRSQASDWDVLVFEDAFDALGKRIHDNRGHFGRQRVYAFVDSHLALNDKQRLELEVLAGPIIHRHKSKSHHDPLTLEVVFAAVPGESQPESKSPRERREQLWSDKRRNQTIASIAKACTDRNSQKLREYGLFLDERDPFLRWSSAPSVSLLTETARHAELLAELLPEWSGLNRRPAAGASTLPGDDWSQWAVPDRSIITAVRAAEYKSFSADIVVMAAGGSCLYLPRGLERRGGRVLVVDFEDRSTPALVRDVASRRKHYGKLCQREV